MIKTIKFMDRTEPEINWIITAETELNEQELQRAVDEIIAEFEKEDYEDWTFEDIVEELEKLGILKTIEHDSLEVWA
jgi:hypothetical protein